MKVVLIALLIVGLILLVVAAAVFGLMVYLEWLALRAKGEVTPTKDDRDLGHGLPLRPQPQT